MVQPFKSVAFHIQKSAEIFQTLSFRWENSRFCICLLNVLVDLESRSL